MIAIYPYLLSVWGKGAEGGSYWFLLATSIAVIMVYNGYFMYSLKAFFTKEHTYNEAISEFVLVFFTGVANIILFAGIYYTFGIDPGDGTALTEDFNTSLYFSIVTWTTLGYGDFSPLPELRLISALQAILGYLYMALFVGIFLNLINVKIKC